MNKIFQSLLAATVILNVIILPALAQTPRTNPASRAETLLAIVEEWAGVPEPQPPEYVIANLIYVALGVVGLILIILIIYGGWLWGSARGNEERVTQAQNLIRNAVIGVIIIFSSFFITTFIVYKIGQANFEPLQFESP